VTPLRLVLDTNVWLDWLVFGDPAIAPIKTALAAGAAEVFIDAPCARELEAVLARRLTKKAANPAEEWQRVVRFWNEAVDPTEQPLRSIAQPSEQPLPACRDPDDQKFLELARDCRADFLVTRDRELLALARRKLRPLPFRIVTPHQMAAALVEQLGD
jgi:putative PIN family toxin of toxin-antitoxin system